jgi:hypothetical protein
MLKRLYTSGSIVYFVVVLITFVAQTFFGVSFLFLNVFFPLLIISFGGFVVSLSVKQKFQHDEIPTALYCLCLVLCLFQVTFGAKAMGAEMKADGNYYRLLIDRPCTEEDCPVFVEVHKCEFLVCSKRYEKQDDESIIFMANRKLLAMSLNDDKSINVNNLQGETIIVLQPFP